MGKPPKAWCSFEDQADRLMKNGLKCSSRESLVEYLTTHNYYHLTGYLYEYKSLGTDSYKDLNSKNKELSFNKIKAIIRFDGFFRALINYQIDIIEKDIKTKIAYYIGKHYGPLGYIQDQQFTSQKDFLRFKKLLKEYKNQNRNKEFIRHHNLYYDGYLPIWVAIEIMPLGMVEKLFSFLDIKTKRKIVKYYPFGLDQFESWLRCLIKFRNLVAHNNRLYRYKVKETPKKSKIYPKLTGLIFDYIVVLRELYPYQDRMEWNEVFIRVISGTCKNNEHLELKEYGFPENWEEVIRIPDKST